MLRFNENSPKLCDRFYSPSLGRFHQPDPIGAEDDINIYVYVKK
ncbi:hypothetical protein AGR7C_Lc20136 [Agrobacterium deltaense Zutra 3/1]|uniref:Uncharacterized protein n=1 Tax=Agrobacterium deltaense Zutra 3/1 TaxID=1183427 RepID=A0A1S7RLX7_9HYPH|nr:hypothetical protein AGR7C_Lc20136 [Agrobacterium deltaense Zutra 3/1]